MFLQGLARDHAVTLVVGSPGFTDAEGRDLASARRLVEDIVLLDFRATNDPFLIARGIGTRLGLLNRPCWDWAMPTPPMRQRLARLRSRTFDRIHVFRLFMLPVALASVDLCPTMSLQLDLDDWESVTRLSIARLAAATEPALARRYAREGAAMQDIERCWLPRMDRVFITNPSDLAALTEKYRLHNLTVVPNPVAVPQTPPAPIEPCSRELLFVGGLGYWPNRDAALFLLEKVCPSIAAERARLCVVGAGAPPELRERLRRSGCRYLPQLRRIEPIYRRAAIALAPVRVGGGTRIKVLEAFARGRPLVATRTAVAGLDVEAGVHYLAAESPAEWGAAIQVLLGDGDCRTRLARTAFSWVQRYDFSHGIHEVARIAAQADEATIPKR